MSVVPSNSSQNQSCSIEIATLKPEKHTPNPPTLDKSPSKPMSAGQRRYCHVFSKYLLFPVLALVILVLFPITIIVAVPLLWVSIIIIRLVRLFASGNSKNHLAVYKVLFRLWMCLNLLLVMLLLGLFYPMAKYVPALKNVVVIGEPLTDWVKIACMLSGYYFLNCVLSIIAITVLLFLLSIDLSVSARDTGLIEAVCEAISSLIFWWAESITLNRVPTLNQQQILGVHLQKWIEVPTFILFGYNMIRFFTYVIVWLLWKVYQNLGPIGSEDGLEFERILCKKYVVYCGVGIRSSINFMLTSVLVLLIWVLDLGPHLNGSTVPGAKSTLDFVTRTCVSLLVCSLLWFLKSCIILSWEAHAAYGRLRSKMVDAGKQLYFLGILGHLDNNCDLLLINNYPENHWKIKTVKDHLLSDKGDEGCSLFDLYLVAQYLLDNKYELSKDSYTSDVIQGLKSRYNEDSGGEGKLSSEEFLKKHISWQQNANDAVQDWEHLEKLLKKAGLSPASSPPSTKADSKQPPPSPPSNKMEMDSKQPPSSPSHEENPLLPPPPAAHEADYNNNNAVESHEADSPPFIAADSTPSSPSCNKADSPVPPSQKEDSPPRQVYFNNVLHEADSPPFIAADSTPSAPPYNKADSPVPPSQEEDSPPRQVYFNNVETWVEEARKSCLFLAKTLSSAHEVEDCLNKIISVLVIAATFLMWLLLTGLATTQVLVLIASPLLAATFIFGDTCRNLFQGIMFVYVLHPISVGDLCFIDGNMMVVNTIGVWKTTFSKVDTQGEVIYPNTELANKVVINYKTDFNWEDCLEFDVGSLDKANINELKTYIKDHLNEKRENITPNSHKVTVLATGEDNVKLAVRFKFQKRNQNWTYSDCQQHKEELRSELSLHIRNIVKHSQRSNRGMLVET